MYRDEILAYVPRCGQEEADKQVMLDYIDCFPDTILTRENLWAHITSSGFIVNADVTKVLFVHHDIYKVWAWTGGHADGDGNLLSVALREAREETGVIHVRPLSTKIASLDLLAVWGHWKRGTWVPGHQHLNVTYLLLADEADELTSRPGENSGVAWLPAAKLPELANEWQMDPIYAKLLERARALL